MLHLPDITLVMIAGDYTELATLAVRDTLDKFSFDRVLIFANETLDVGYPTVHTSVRSSYDAGKLAFDIAPQIQTGHAMFIEWDGYPVCPDLWSDSFRSYDYIGAVWPWFQDWTVGNSGFCLRSRRAMDALHSDHHIVYGEPGDILIGRTKRSYLESAHGLRFPDEATADLFSIEHGPAYPVSFGFHGLWNMIYFMKEDQIRDRIRLLKPKQWRGQQVDTTAYRALVDGRRDLYRWILRERELNG